MIDVRNSDEVLSLLGQPSLEAIGQSVARTRDDLDEYRRAVPRLAARQTQRGILNWIRDQLFANVRDLFEAHVSSVQVRDVEPRREIYVADLFRLRFKKHGPADMVSSYPTEAFKDFIVQDPPQLLQEIRLIGVSVGTPKPASLVRRCCRLATETTTCCGSSNWSQRPAAPRCSLRHRTPRALALRCR